MRSRFGSIPAAQCSLNETQPSASKRTELRKLKIITGLKTLSSKLPCDAANPMAASLPMTWTATIVSDSLCVGLTFPGMIEDRGSFSGIVSSPRPQRGPDASQRISLAIFMQDDARLLRAPLAKTNSLCAESGANPEFGVGVQPRADSRTADGKGIEAVQRSFNALNVLVEKGRIAGKLLT